MRLFKINISLSLLLVCFVAANAQQQKDPANDGHYNISGIVREAATGKTLGGIKVTYKDYSAAITDSTGAFTLKVPSPFVSVLLEGEGYQTKQVALKGNDRIEAALYEDTYTSFYDAANFPSGAIAKSQSPFAVTSIQTNGNWGQTIETPSTYLQGRAAGLNAIRRSGTPGIGATMFLRGINSLYATNQPLIIVDGIIFDNTNYGSLISGSYTEPLSTIDPKDIDNITVIKDGSSIYGTKGANGVIIITTARAKELGTKIDFAIYGGINFKPAEYPVMDAGEHRIYLSEILKSKGLTDDQIQALPYMNDDKGNPDYYRYHNTTDWQDQVYQQTNARNIYLKVTGGDNIAKYALSLGYMRNGGLTTGTGLTRYNMRFNGDLNLNRKLTATTNLSFTFNDRDLRDQGIAPKTNPVFLALVKSPLIRVHEVSDAGIESPVLSGRDTFNITNPVVITNNASGSSRNYRFFGSIGFNYQVLKSLSIETTIGVIYDKTREDFFIPAKGVTTDTLSNDIVTSRSGSMVESFFSLYNDTRVVYSKRFNNIHSLSTRIGFRYLRSKAEQDFGLGYNSPIDQLVSVQFGSNALRQVGGSIGESSWLNTYFNADYSYSDKYFLSFNMAMDGSSRFGKEIPGAVTINGNKYALLPSIAGAWLISSEKFLKWKRLDLLKLRASFGLAGNDDIGNYTARQTYIPQNFLGLQGLVRSGFGNNQLQWEKATKLNAGLDISVLNERLNITFDGFHNKTSKMLVYEAAPPASGADFTITNSGAMSTNGVEASVNARIIDKPIKWDIGVTVARSTTTVDHLPVEKILTYYSGATYVTIKGGAPNRFYGYVSNGVFVSDAAAAQEALSLRNPDGSLVPFKGGDIRFADLNNDHVIDDMDRKVIGDPNPSVFGAVTTKLGYKGFSLDVLFTFMQGNDIYNYTRNQLESELGYYNQTTAIINRWKTNGDVTNIPKATWGDPMGNSRFSDRWIEDGSYFRLRTVTLSYNIPIRQSVFQYAAVYLTGNNLFTLTRYKGFDPEFSASESIFGQGIDNTLEPQVRSVQLGLRIGL